jgi:hypothetical protein
MEELLTLDLEEGEGGQRARIVTRSYPSDDRGFVSLTPYCGTPEEMERAVEDLKARLDTLLAEARKVFLPLPQPNRMEQEPFEPESPEELWHAMARCKTLEAMQRLFNPRDPELRREVADLVFSRVNVFKGPGALFSQHYNDEKGLLE